MLIQRGQRYRVVNDTPAICMTYWKAPYTGGVKVVVPAGEVLVVTADPSPRATGADLLPERYDALLAKFVPFKERSDPKFGGYSLCLMFDQIDANCQLVTEE